MVDFTLSPKQVEIQQHARKLATEHLKQAASVYSKHSDQKSRFHATRPFYQSAVTNGILKSWLPVPLGGTSEGFLDCVIAIEELFAVEPGISLTLAASVLGLLPLILAGTPDQQGKYIKPFLSGDGSPLASFMHSEPNGTANWLEEGGLGLETTARPSKDGWIINGEKLWTSNSAGWDDKGADLACIVCRMVDTGSPQDDNSDLASRTIIFLITRDTIAANKESAYQVIEEPELYGHVSTSGPHTRFTEFFVPKENILVSSNPATEVVERSFGISAALVGAMTTGVMRTAVDSALDFAKSDTRRGSKPILAHQRVADKLIDCQLRIETSRLLTWKAASSLDNQGLEWHDQLTLALQAKIFTSDIAVDCVLDTMKVVGIGSYAKTTDYPKLLQDVICYCLFDGGNIGVRRRQLQEIMLAKDSPSEASAKARL